MPILRLAYATLFLIAVIAVFVLWSQAGGQGHLDLMPWYLKVGLGAGSAYAVVRATMAAVEGKTAWNSGSLKWTGILIALLVACGLATYYYHVYEEGGDEDQEDSVTSGLVMPHRELRSHAKAKSRRVTPRTHQASGSFAYLGVSAALRD